MLTKEELEFYISQGEGYNTEFKESQSTTIGKEMSAFANASGGKIFIGITDSGARKEIKITNKLKSEIQDIGRNLDPKMTVQIQEVDEYLLPRPVLEVSDAYFGISFERPDLQKMSIEQRMQKYKKDLEKGVEEGVEKGVEKLSEKQKIIVTLIRQNNQISKEEMVKKGNISKKTVEYNINVLKGKGIIRRIGPDKGGYWEIVGE